MIPGWKAIDPQDASLSRNYILKESNLSSTFRYILLIIGIFISLPLIVLLLFVPTTPVSAVGVIYLLSYGLIVTGMISAPWWPRRSVMILLTGVTMALGTVTGGWRIMRTLGSKITKLETHQGFAAEMAAASTIEMASRLGIPLSTTHTISTAIMGVGATRNVSAVRWGVTRELVTAWILTFPICAAISWGVVKALRSLS